MSEDPARVDVQRPEVWPALQQLGDEAALREPVRPAQAVAVGVGLGATAREAQASPTRRRLFVRFSAALKAGWHTSAAPARPWWLASARQQGL